MLINSSIDDIGIVPLAKKLNVTKGSFYWHFKNHDELLRSILTTWRQRIFDRVIERVEKKSSDPRERIFSLLDVQDFSKRAHNEANVETAMREWARRNKMAADTVSEVDKLRLTYITNLYIQLGMDEDTAYSYAFMAYSFILGISLIEPKLTTEEKQRRKEVFKKILALSDD